MRMLLSLFEFEYKTDLSQNHSSQYTSQTVFDVDCKKDTYMVRTSLTTINDVRCVICKIYNGH